eukprot:GHVS01091251.1.p2 GENE.GHVS01091251.1~~GHVS01091251.1.p2  ORF type:complete len:110 (+),score=66.41 GHVS01091251.1:363-692(+)
MASKTNTVGSYDFRWCICYRIFLHLDVSSIVAAVVVGRGSSSGSSSGSSRSSRSSGSSSSSGSSGSSSRSSNSSNSGNKSSSSVSSVKPCLCGGVHHAICEKYEEGKGL